MKKLKFCRQTDTRNCGAACVVMACSLYGKVIPITYINTLCQSSLVGWNLLKLIKVGNEVGLNIHAVTTTIDKLVEYNRPAILHWNGNHYVMLFKISKHGQIFHIADPAKGKIKYSREEMEKYWTLNGNAKGKAGRGVACFTEPNNFFYNPCRDFDGSRSSSIIELWNYVKTYKRYFIHIFLGLLLGSMFQLIFPFLTRAVVDVGMNKKNISLILLILCGEMIIVIAKAITNFIRRWLVLHISLRINIKLISRFFIKLLKLPMSFFESRLVGDLLQRIRDHNRIENFLTQELFGALFALLTLFICGTVLFLFNKFIFIIFLAFCIGYSVWVVVFLKKREMLDYELFEKMSIHDEKTLQFISNLQEIKLQHCENQRRWEWEDSEVDLFYIKTKSLKLQQLQESGAIFINELRNILITVFAALEVIDGQMSLGTMMAILFMIGQLSSPVETLMTFMYSIQDVKISMARINAVHSLKNENEDSNLRESFSGPLDIFFKNVSFKYDRFATSNVLTNVDLPILANKVTAIVGASGSGKSTLLKLLLGYYKVDKGEIIIGGCNINDYNLDWWRSRCGVVLQDGVVFSDTIMRNIAIGEEDIDFSKLDNAVKIANIQEFIGSLPQGYNTMIGREGRKISQGQKQRILIARAVYKNPDILILDEATNSLDTHNEKILVKNLKKFYSGKTVVLVAHRLSTVVDADNIIVLKDGLVVESGTHTELVGKKNLYYNLVRNQLNLSN